MATLYGGDCQQAQKELMSLGFLEIYEGNPYRFKFRCLPYPDNFVHLYPYGSGTLQSKALYVINSKQPERYLYGSDIDVVLRKAGFDVLGVL